MASIKELSANIVKLDRFDGGDFLRWQKRVHFLLVALHLVYVLDTPKPMESDDETVEQIRKRQKWETDDHTCRGHILNAMKDSLCSTSTMTSPLAESWEKLEARYHKEDATSKKFLISKFINFKMVDERSLMEQFREVERIRNNFSQHNLVMDETIVVSSIIDKLPPSWKEFKRTLKHKKEDISLDELANHLRVEEDCRMQENEKEQNAQEISKVHVMEAAKFKKPFLNRPNKLWWLQKLLVRENRTTKIESKEARKSLVGSAWERWPPQVRMLSLEEEARKKSCFL
ncbi:hypothetical protein Scep_001153 [Stephania cephalantha]|uniref:Uncharacterized protein n=1 Tax=Stephania cephalantha TaxID=152367 RepID=A0AAP0L8X2_9MAGN